MIIEFFLENLKEWKSPTFTFISDIYFNELKLF